MYAPQLIAGILFCSLSAATTVWSMTLAERGTPVYTPTTYTGFIGVWNTDHGQVEGYLDTGAGGPSTIRAPFSPDTGFNVLPLSSHPSARGNFSLGYIQDDTNTLVSCHVRSRSALTW